MLSTGDMEIPKTQSLPVRQDQDDLSSSHSGGNLSQFVYSKYDFIIFRYNDGIPVFSFQFRIDMTKEPYMEVRLRVRGLYTPTPILTLLGNKL